MTPYKQPQRHYRRFERRPASPTSQGGPASPASGSAHSASGPAHAGGLTRQRPQPQAIIRRDFRPSGLPRQQAGLPAQTGQKIVRRDLDKTLRIIPLGGVEEVGRNMTVVEYQDDIIIIDMGLQFPEEDMPGIDYIIPNVKYLQGKEKNIRGVIITHAHYDHIGAIPHLIPKLGNPPIYSADLTLAIIRKRLEEYKTYPIKLEAHIINKDSKLKLGAFNVEFFGVSHNVPASFGVIVRTPAGIVLHTGDFKIDERSPIAGVTELDKLSRISREKPLLLMADSTNAREIGKQASELDIMTDIEEIVKSAKGRLIFGTFSSLLGRLNEIIQVGARHGKKIIIEGRSMKINVEIAKQLGYITIPKNTVIPVEEMKHYPDDKIMVLATGAQGEDRAVLMRIANREHRFIEPEPGDTFVFSSSVIPGNERTVQRLTDKLYREGIEVINYRMMDIHAGGHAKQEDLKKMIETVQPKFFMPIEGNHSFLRIHAKVAKRAGYDDKNILVADNGQVVACKDGVCALTKERVPTDYVFVDGLGVGDVGQVVIRDRQMLAEDGIFVVIAVVDSKTGKVKGSPDIISRGFIYLRESKDLLQQVRKRIRDIVDRSAPPGQETVNWAYVRDNIREQIGQFLYSKTQRRPMVLPVVIEV